MLELLIPSKVRRKLLTLFLLNPEDAFYIREVEKKVGEDFRAVRRELSRLEKAGLLHSWQEANLKYYAINKGFSLYPELKSIIIKTEGLGDAIRQGLAPLGNIKYAFIFGSLASGEERAGSDIDLMIVGDVDPAKLSTLLSSIEDKLRREINPSVYSAQEFDQRRAEANPFITNVLAAQKIMLIGDEHELSRPVEATADQKTQGQPSRDR